MLHLPIERFGSRYFRPAPPPGGFTPNPGAGGSSGAGAAGGGAAAAGGGGSAAAAGGGPQQDPGKIYNAAAWLLQPSSFLDIDKYNSIALPAIAATAVVLKFQIPSGRHAKISGIGIDVQQNGATGAGEVFLQGVKPFQLTFKLFTNAVGTAFADFALFNYAPGSCSDPMGIAGLMVKESQTVTLTVTNNSLVVADPTQFIGAHIQGYSYPKNLEPKNMGYQ